MISAKINTDSAGASKGSAFVQFEKQTDAIKAITALNDTDWSGSKISVEVFKKNPERDSKFNNLYVEGFAETMTEDRLRAVFEEFGEVMSLSIPNPSRRFGYVCFKTHEEAALAIEKVNGTEIDEGGPLNVTRHLKKSELMKKSVDEVKSQIKENDIINLTANLFLKNIPKDANEDTIKKAFEAWGAVSSVRINHDSHVAYVCYVNADHASTAIYEATLASPFPGTPGFSVDYFVPKTMRKKQEQEFENQHFQQHFYQGMMSMMYQGPYMHGGHLGGGMGHRGRGRFQRGGPGRGRGGRGRGGYPRNQAPHAHPAMPPTMQAAAPSTMPPAMPAQAPQKDNFFGMTVEAMNALGSDLNMIR